jgi:hypothetical protein
MNWGKTEYINRIFLLETGELFVGIAGDGNSYYQFVYREAAGVYWDPTLKGFKSTELKGWTPSQWFAHIVHIVRMGIGVQLAFCDPIEWNGISVHEKAAIEGTIKTQLKDTLHSGD